MRWIRWPETEMVPDTLPAVTTEKYRTPDPELCSGSGVRYFSVVTAGKVSGTISVSGTVSTGKAFPSRDTNSSPPDLDLVSRVVFGGPI